MKGRILQLAMLYFQKEGEDKAGHIEHWKDCVAICKELGIKPDCHSWTYKDSHEFPPLRNPIKEWPEKEPVYNIGPERIMFCVGPDADFSRIRSLGVTVIQCYELPYINMTAYLDKARDNNLKVFYSLIGQDDKGISDNVRWCRDHPALYCWHTFEEINLTANINHQRQKQVYDFIKKRDPKHPITQTISGFVKKTNGGYDWDYINFDALDFLTPDLYVYDGTGDCWGMKPLEALELGARQEREYLDSKNIQKPVVFTFQCCDEPALGAGNHDTRVPLGHIEDQFKVVEKHSLLTGGLMLWAWNHGYFGPATSDEMFEEIKSLFDKIRGD